MADLVVSEGWGSDPWAIPCLSDVEGEGITLAEVVRELPVATHGDACWVGSGGACNLGAGPATPRSRLRGRTVIGKKDRAKFFLLARRSAGTIERMRGKIAELGARRRAQLLDFKALKHENVRMREEQADAKRLARELERVNRRLQRAERRLATKRGAAARNDSASRKAEEAEEAVSRLRKSLVAEREAAARWAAEAVSLASNWFGCDGVLSDRERDQIVQRARRVVVTK
jgi:hypothetical protein